MAMSEVKRKRVSKKNKKAWRKHTDIKDVEAFLEDVRLEERLGKPFKDRQDEELFVVDTTGTESKTNFGIQYAKSNFVVGEEKKPEETKRKSLRLAPPENPRCFSLLNQRSAVNDPLIKRNRVKTSDERKTRVALMKQDQRRIKKLQMKNSTRKPKPVKLNETVVKENIWEKDDNIRKLEGHAYWCNNDTIRHTLHNTGHKSKLKPGLSKLTPSILPAVESPHPGISYNPSSTDYNTLLSEVAEQEIISIKKDEHINRVTKDLFKKYNNKEVQSMWIKEMSGGLNDNSDNEYPASDNEYKTVNPPVKNKKKTLKQRRKQKLIVKQKEELKRKKIEKRKLSDLQILKKVHKSVDKIEEKMNKLTEKRKQKKALKKTATKKLSKVKFENAEPDFQMPSDLSGSLRGIKPEGNILVDRYKSLQKRNIIEPVKVQVRKKVKVKKFDKKTHKMDWET